ncbi:MAG: Hydrolase 4 protein [Actinomycetota bacterium]|nr:Hydrolase 4 protein [Actinomycetota bacterium]
MSLATLRDVLLAPVRTPVSFWNGMDRLVGDLVLPAWQGPHPVAVFVEGAGPGGRDQGSWPDRLAAAGIGSLAFDKPGCGESTGDWTQQTLRDRATEVLVAVDAIRALPEVDEQAVALIGGSQGAWVASLAAANSDDIAALVMSSGPAVGVLAQEFYRLGRQLPAHGFSRDEVSLAQALLRERLRRLLAGAHPEEVYAAEAACHNAPWYGFMPGTTPEEMAFVARVAGYDPVPVLAAIRCPLLALYGQDDVFIPVEESLRVLERTLAASRHEDHDMVVVPHADHGLRIFTGDGPTQLVYGHYSPGEIAPGVLELIVTWLDRRIGR